MAKLKSYRGISYETAKQKLEMWLKAEDAIALSQSYTIEGRSLTRANLAEVRQAIEYWGDLVSRMEQGVQGIKLQRVMPCDW